MGRTISGMRAIMMLAIIGCAVATQPARAQQPVVEQAARDGQALVTQKRAYMPRYATQGDVASTIQDLAAAVGQGQPTPPAAATDPSGFAYVLTLRWQDRVTDLAVDQAGYEAAKLGTLVPIRIRNVVANNAIGLATVTTQIMLAP